MVGSGSLEALLAEVRACTHCAAELPLGPRPVLRARASARLLIIGQAPGTKVHESGIPWDDPSGDRLRDWLQVDKETFYDEGRIAIVPMGFCYPGRAKSGGDAPPRPECAPLWHQPVLAALPNVELTMLVGTYAQAHYLGKRRQKTMTETVRVWHDYGPDILPTPHPSWRTTGWQKKNPWFEEDVLPPLRKRVAGLMG
jgi:uracil-DNA glycosylase